MWGFKRQPERPAAKTDAAEPGLRALEAASALADALPDPALLLSRAGMVLHANPGATALLEQNPVGQHLSAAIRAPVILSAFNAALEGKGPLKVEFERRVPLESHHEAWLAPISGADAQGPAVLLSLKDLTREQMIERMRADFVANASHELRTPLTALLGFIETLQGPARNDEPARERFLGLMRQQGDRMRRLIDDLLSLSRIEMNAHQHPQGLVDAGQLLRQVADSFSPMAAEQGVELTLDITLELRVRGDADELTQVLQNLIENALKYAASGKRIELSAARTPQGAELAVRDHGPGIAAEHLPRLTERFYRVSVQESRSRGGTGLGLAIVKHIVMRHRGKLAIQSEPGRGSRFAVVLPLVD